MLRRGVHFEYKSHLDEGGWHAKCKACSDLPASQRRRSLREGLSKPTCAASDGGKQALAHAVSISSGRPPIFLVPEEQTFAFDKSAQSA
jgi:hypothetical protein